MLKTATITKNRYDYPIDMTKVTKIDTHSSKAHVGPLKFSVDFKAPKGTAVFAAAEGRVVDLKKDGKLGGNSRKYERHGNFIEIYHKNSEYSEYEHLSRVLVRHGDLVKKGQIIGYSGATGWLSNLGPHLHFMVGVYNDYHTLKISWAKQLKRK